ncbi:MAG: hypothetical protein ACK46X_18370 [Candidatus Sericytochromatia bacterium]
MDKSIFGNKLGNLGALNGLSKKVSAPEAPAKAEPKAKVAGGFASDALVRTGAAAGGAVVTNAAAAAELRLANAYDADPATFARNLAKASLQELVSNLG